MPRTKQPERPRAAGAPYTIKQAAEALNVSGSLVRNYLADGTLVGYREGRSGRNWRIPEAEVQAYLDRRQAANRPAIDPGPIRHLKLGRGTS
jgi:excisionase family DNA binding protein